MKRILTLFLAFVTVAVLFTSCGPDKKPDSDPTPSTTASPSSSSTSGTSDEPTPTPTPTETSLYNAKTDLPDGLNFNDAEINCISRIYSIYKDEITLDGGVSDGDPILNSIYQRNLNVEQQLGLKINNFKTSSGGDFMSNFDILNILQNEMGAKTYNYDIIFSPSFACVYRTADALWEDLTTVDNLNLSKEYWSQLYNEQVHIGNRQFFATGVISLSLKRMVYATMFNKKLAENYAVEDLYNVVRENRWTLEYQGNVIQNMYEKLDSAQEGPSKGDMYGFISNTNLSSDPYWTIYDIQVFTRTDDDYLEFNFDTERNSNIFEAVRKLYHDNDNVFLYPSVGEGDEQAEIRKHFAEGRAFMAHMKLQELEEADIRGMEDQYGVLPLPKLEQNELPYYSSAFHAFTVVGVLKGQSDQDLAMCGAFLEAMSCESYNLVQPAYFEVSLKGKYTKDPDSWEMLDNMMTNFRVDQDLLYSSTDSIDILQMFRNGMAGNNKNFASLWSTFSLTMQKRTLTKHIDAIRAMNGD